MMLAVYWPFSFEQPEWLWLIATIPYGVLGKFAAHPLTDKGLKAFLDDWEKSKQK